MKTSELTGAALDWAVAKCEGVNEEAFRLFYKPTDPTYYDSHGYPEFHYSTVWSQGGPIIEREGISLACRPKDARGLWCAVLGPNRFLSPDFEGYGPTPLIAAMRCYVLSKLGDNIDIPEELK